MILSGYEHNVDEVNAIWFSYLIQLSIRLSDSEISHILQVVQDLLNCLDNPELPFLQWQECFAVLATRLPKDLRNMVNTCILRCSLF